MQVDYGEGAPTRVPGTDRWRKPRLFVATLRYSRRSFRRVVWKSSQQVWAELHEQAWRYFGGSCRYVVLDNLKEGVLKPDLYEPELNPVYAATLAHYEVVADPARVRDPNRKGTCGERHRSHPGHGTQGPALRDHRRAEHLPGALGDQVGGLAHPRQRAPPGAGHVRGRAPHLQPLPTLPMQYFTEEQRTVCDDGCVRVDHSSYAARPAPIGTKVLVRMFERRIEIRDLQTQALLRTHTRPSGPAPWCCPWTSASSTPRARPASSSSRPMPSGRTPPGCARCCLPSKAVWASASCGASSPGRRYPRQMVNTACPAMDDGVHSYRHVKALTERLVARLWPNSMPPRQPTQAAPAST
jgi:hypothetical protein